MAIIKTRNIAKSYGGVKALYPVSLDIEEGEIFGLIGPDGAGKTSLIRILTTLILPDQGSAEVLGLDVVKDFREIRNKIGYMPGRFSLYQDLSVEENLNLFASLFGTSVDQNYHLIKDIYTLLEPFKDRKAGQLSGGMKQKLALCCALIHEPGVLFLDEPTTGVDPVSRKEFWEMLGRLKDRNITILVSTPYMDEASLCDRVGLIQEGRLLQIDSPQNIVKQFGKDLYSVVSSSKYKLIKSLRKYPFSDTVYPFGDSIHYTDKRPSFPENDLRKFLEAENIQDFKIDQINPGIEDCFMDLIQTKE